jgi:peroxiredoxin family protein
METQGDIRWEKSQDSATIVVFSGELDRALAAFNIATAAASMGMDVTMFFTFWGLNVVRRERGGGGRKTPLQRMLGLMNRGGSRRLRLPACTCWGAAGRP